MDESVIIEAIIFSAGKPVGAEEIAQACGLTPDAVRAGLKKLVAGYDKRQTAIEIAKVGSKYCMQLKPDVLPQAGALAPATIPKSVLKTAALIAYYQPIKQSKLLAMVGARVYEHVKFLTDVGLVSAKKYSHTFILTTSKKFPEYFGIPTAKRDDIKKWIAEKVGIKLSAKLPSSVPDESAAPDGSAASVKSANAGDDAVEPPEDDAQK